MSFEPIDLSPSSFLSLDFACLTGKHVPNPQKVFKITSRAALVLSSLLGFFLETLTTFSPSIDLKRHFLRLIEQET